MGFSAGRGCFRRRAVSTQLDLVAHGLGIALAPKAVICGYGMSQMAKQLGVAELAGPEICWELAAVFAQDEAQQPVGVVTRTFLEFLRASITLLDESGLAESDIAMAG